MSIERVLLSSVQTYLIDIMNFKKELIKEINKKISNLLITKKYDIRLFQIILSSYS